MTLRIANRVFAPRAWAVLATVVFVALFCWLGSWQLARGHEKRVMMEIFERASKSSIALGIASVDALPKYQRVTVRGHYDPAHQVLLDNMPSATGQPGYRVLTPFVRVGSTRTLMVDRGWVALGRTRADIPVVGVAMNERGIAGRLDTFPAPGVRVGEAGTEGDTMWPRVLNFPRQQDVERVLGAPIESRIVLLDPALPDGFERVWHPSLGFGPERHLGYAVQWFAFAVTTLVIFVSLSLRSANPSDEVNPLR